MVQNPLKLSSWPKMAPECEVKRNSWLSWSQVDAKMRQIGAKMGTKMCQIGAKVALSCATWRQDGPKMANLRAFLEASRQLFEILDAKPQIAKTLKNNRFFQCFF